MKIRNLLSITALTLIAGVAFAGQVQPAVVFIDEANMFAQGDMWTARTAKNDVEFIGCGIRVVDDGVSLPFSFGFCQAQDSAEVLILCTTLSADLVEAIKGISDTSFLTFSWNASFECTRIGASTQSFYLPEFKTKKN